MGIKLHNSRGRCSYQNLYKWHSCSCALLILHCYVNALWDQKGINRTAYLLLSPGKCSGSSSLPELDLILEIGTRTRPLRFYQWQSQSIHFPAVEKAVQPKKRYGLFCFFFFLKKKQNSIHRIKQSRTKENINIYFTKVIKIILLH